MPQGVRSELAQVITEASCLAARCLRRWSRRGRYRRRGIAGRDIWKPAAGRRGPRRAVPRHFAAFSSSAPVEQISSRARFSASESRVSDVKRAVLTRRSPSCWFWFDRLTYPRADHSRPYSLQRLTAAHDALSLLEMPPRFAIAPRPAVQVNCRDDELLGMLPAATCLADAGRRHGGSPLSGSHEFDPGTQEPCARR